MVDAVVRLFVEDRAHDEFVRALVERVAKEERRSVSVHTATARGGHSYVWSELKLFLKVVGQTPDLLVVAIDCNCNSLTAVQSRVTRLIDSARFPRCAYALPDPHIERWYLSDPEALYRSLCAEATLDAKKCERDRYKQQLVDAIQEAGKIVTLGGAEFAREIVEAMDFYRAGRNESSLRHFVRSLRGHMRVPRQ